MLLLKQALGPRAVVEQARGPSAAARTG